MANEFNTLITDVGLQRLSTAAGSGGQVAITHVALGDGNGARYEASADQTALRRERARVGISSRRQIDGGQWLVRSEFPPDETVIFEIREFGFFDADGALIFVWAEQGVQIGQAGLTTFLLDHALDFSQVRDGLIFVDAPQDDALDEAFGLSVVATLARQTLDHHTLWEAFRAAHGHYPGE